MSKPLPSVAMKMFAIMDGDKLTMIVAKDPNRAAVMDITGQLAMLLHRSASMQFRKSDPENAE